ncbi:hypothetical protein [Pollutimonas nitritireducens]|uniref:hypothetical protein n=1 Tax=Pollutimonas nitritireducens TaxID=2045209 RepID=UPI001304689F|nr:hypothetical protein [Pollutimonas nitritireducens]
MRYAFVGSDANGTVCGVLKIADVTQHAIGIHGNATSVVGEKFSRLGKHHPFPPPFE